MSTVELLIFFRQLCVAARDDDWQELGAIADYLPFYPIVDRDSCDEVIAALDFEIEWYDKQTQTETE